MLHVILTLLHRCMFVLFSKGAWSHGPTYSGLIEDIEGLLNDRNYKVSLVLVSEQNGEVKESDPVSTFFKTRMFIFHMYMI